MEYDFLISWTHIPHYIDAPKGGIKCFKTTTFSELEPYTDNHKCWAQNIVTDERMTTHNLDYSKWTGVTFYDIDSKHWWRKDNSDLLDEVKLEQNPPSTVLGVIVHWLNTHYPFNFCAAETSRSGLGYHFYFLWDCSKTEDNFDYYYQVGFAIIKRAFKECGYDFILNFPKVIDTCTKSYLQGAYPTKKNLYTNYKCNGSICSYNELDIDTSSIERKKKNKENKSKFNQIENLTGVKIGNKKRHIKLKKKEQVNNVEYLEHHSRWLLFDSLYQLFPNADKLREEWEYCCRLIPEKNGHNISFYINEPYANHWDEEIINNLQTGNTDNIYFSKKLLKQFGYDIEIIRPNINDTFKDVFGINL